MCATPLISITGDEGTLNMVEAAEETGRRSAGIGPRLRAARLSRGMSLANLAAGAGLTKGFLSQVERDLVSPSVGSLLRVCEALGVGVGELFEPASGPLVRAADRPAIAFGGDGVDEFQLTPAGERRLQVIQSDIAPGGGSGDDAYGLGSEAEFVHVLAGAPRIEGGSGGHPAAPPGPRGVDRPGPRGAGAPPPPGGGGR